jgi:hypothetical protein
MGTFFQWLIDLFRDVRFWFVVEPWEKAVRVRLGKNSLVMPPGFHWKIPVLDEIYVINTRLRIAPAATQTLSTKDGSIVTLGVQFGFSIIEPLMALSSYLHPEMSVAVIAQNFIAEYITNHNKTDLSIAELEDYVEAGLKDLDPNGISIEFVKVTSFISSGPAKSFRLINDSIHTDFSTDVSERVKWRPNVTQW